MSENYTRGDRRQLQVGNANMANIPVSLETMVEDLIACIRAKDCSWSAEDAATMLEAQAARIKELEAELAVAFSTA